MTSTLPDYAEQAVTESMKRAQEAKALRYQIKDEFGFDINRLAEALFQERSNRESLEIRLEENFLRRIQEATRIATQQAEEKFRDNVLSFSQGCDSGKNEFLEFCGLPPQQKRVRFWVDAVVPYNADLHDLASRVDDYLSEDDNVTTTLNFDYDYQGLEDE